MDSLIANARNGENAKRGTEWLPYHVMLNSIQHLTGTFPFLSRLRSSENSRKRRAESSETVTATADHSCFGLLAAISDSYFAEMAKAEAGSAGPVFIYSDEAESFMLDSFENAEHFRSLRGEPQAQTAIPKEFRAMMLHSVFES